MKQVIDFTEDRLLEKFINIYNNITTDVAEVSLNLKELRHIILLLKNDWAMEEILDFELFNRREIRQKHQSNKGK